MTICNIIETYKGLFSPPFASFLIGDGQLEYTRKQLLFLAVQMSQAYIYDLYPICDCDCDCRTTGYILEMVGTL